LAHARLDQLDDNLACLETSLSERQLQRLNEVSAIEFGFPADFYLPSRRLCSARCAGAWMRRRVENRAWAAPLDPRRAHVPFAGKGLKIVSWTSTTYRLIEPGSMNLFSSCSIKLRTRGSAKQTHRPLGSVEILIENLDDRIAFALDRSIDLSTGGGRLFGNDEVAPVHCRALRKEGRA